MPFDNQNEVIKAVIVNSAFPNILDKTGNETIDRSDPNWAQQVEPWNADRGYGRIDALKAFQTLSEGKILPNINVNTQKGWTYQSMTQNYETDTYQIYGLKNERLVLTVTWNRAARKIGGGYYDESSPKFNLDLTIKSPSGAVLFTETDTLNNLQKADILLPEDSYGENYYEITIANTTTKKNRSYALAFEVLQPLVADFNIDYVVNTDDLVDFMPYWLNMDCTGDCLPYDLDPDSKIDLSDYSIFAEKWLTYDPRYYSP
jgi:hypothetical protein